jgi:hypothetical protein
MLCLTVWVEHQCLDSRDFLSDVGCPARSHSVCDRNAGAPTCWSFGSQTKRPHLNLAAILAAALVISASGCQSVFKKAEAGPPPVLAAGALLPSPRLVVGRVLAVDPGHGFAFVELAPDAPAAALNAGTELNVRTLELRDTARIEVSRYLRGRTLGAKIVEGQPAPGDEVVWLAP